MDIFHFNHFPFLRSSRQEVFCEKGAPDLQLYWKREKVTLVQVFSCEFCEISKNTFLHRTPLVAASAFLRELLLIHKNQRHI